MSCGCKKDDFSMPIKDGNTFYFTTTDFDTAVLLEINPFVGTMIRHFNANARTYLAGDYIKYVFAFKQDVDELLKKNFKGKKCFSLVTHPVNDIVQDTVVTKLAEPLVEDIELIYDTVLQEVQREEVQEVVVEKKRRTKKQVAEVIEIEQVEDIDK